MQFPIANAERNRGVKYERTTEQIMRTILMTILGTAGLAIVTAVGTDVPGVVGDWLETHHDPRIEKATAGLVTMDYHSQQRNLDRYDMMQQEIRTLKRERRKAQSAADKEFITDQIEEVEAEQKKLDIGGGQ